MVCLSKITTFWDVYRIRQATDQKNKDNNKNFWLDMLGSKNYNCKINIY